MAFTCNLKGSHKVQISIIWRTKSPQCFRYLKCPPLYQTQSNAWSHTEIFNASFFNQFLRSVRNATSKKALFLMGYFGSQGALVCPIKQVWILNLLQNVTSVYESLSQGIIASTKQYYRLVLLRRFVKDTDGRHFLLHLWNSRPAGTKGLDEYHLTHSLEAAEMLEASWEQVSPETIRNFWIRSRFLTAWMGGYLKRVVLGKTGEDLSNIEI